MINGNGLSRGVAVGKVLLLKKSSFNITNDKVDDVESELKKLDDNLNLVISDTEELINNLDGQEKEIMEAHLLILQDPTLVDEAKRLISEEHYNILYAVDVGLNTVIKMFEIMDDPYFRERSRDICDIKNRILEKISGIKKVSVDKLPKNTIICSYELTTTETAQMDFKNVVGIITEVGGATSHSCIMARTHSIPAVSGIKDIYSVFKDNEKIAMNGESGEIFINPSPDKLLEFSKIKKALDSSINEIEAYRGKESVTKDGKKVKLYANIGNVEDAKNAVSGDCEGIGLFRSEFLYMDSSKLPSEDEQFEAYKNVCSNKKFEEVIIRTLDIGGDKKLSYLEMNDEDNPFLGCRAIRLCLNNISLFKTQLRAILRASHYGKIAIMFPMISSINELREAKKVLEECKKELDSEGILFDKDIKVGIMIEIPATALNARNFAKECDFFSIGTNDLIQYTIAVERGNEAISSLYTKYNPGVLKLIKMAIDGAHQEGIICGMCGEAAGNELYAPLLIGMGLDEFSMGANSILSLRKTISKLDSNECKKFVDEVIELPQAREIREAVKNFMNK